MQNTPKKIIEDYQKRLLPHIAKYIANKNLLDVGCGNGFNSYFFSKHFATEITLVDVEDIRDEEVSPFPFFQSSLEKLPFKSSTFDIVFLQYVLHHLPPEIHIEAVFWELKRVGKMVIIVEEVCTENTHIHKAIEYDSKMNAILHPNSGNILVHKYYSDAELKEVFSKVSLDIIEEKTIFHGSEENGYLIQRMYVLK
ncbi:MAG TPA: class I SAM-dependent methyltransferase [Saprospiraceae bacterium]|nr:class I SAM-dependent methyltransferase [Saprospiraceae bacterium]